MSETIFLRSVLQQARTIAVVGLSADSSKPSYLVSKYMQEHGYRIIPVNPKYQQILGEKCYPNLRSIPEPVDMVDVFRKSSDTVHVAEDAVAIGAKTLWLQIGVINDEARRIAESNGVIVVMDRCVKIEHASLQGGPA
jgi:predicted CoA-binding protein